MGQGRDNINANDRTKTRTKTINQEQYFTANLKILTVKCQPKQYSNIRYIEIDCSLMLHKITLNFVQKHDLDCLCTVFVYCLRCS